MTDSPAAASKCPLCGKDNQCAVAAGRPRESCWCQNTTIDVGARAKARAMDAADRCLCPACGQSTGEQSDEG